MTSSVASYSDIISRNPIISSSVESFPSESRSSLLKAF